ncbi:MAG: hypothetical protein K2K28_04180, partial [Clostridia bacterium]|nr:hypothetical protein [Clostridia bacterium]
MFAQVIVDIAHSQVDKIFEYSCPDSLIAGSRVKVPFGGRVIDGFVIGVSPISSYPADKVKPVAQIFDEPPALIPECTSLMHGIASRYRVPKAVALRLFLPSEMRLGKVHEVYKKYVVYTGEDIKLPSSAKKQAEALKLLKEEKECDFTRLCERFGRGAVNALIEKGAAKMQKRKIPRSPFSGLPEGVTAKLLTPAQNAALEEIESAKHRVN